MGGDEMENWEIGGWERGEIVGMGGVQCDKSR